MVYIGIGSNLGNRINNIEKAKYFLKLNGINIQNLLVITRLYLGQVLVNQNS